MSGIGPKDVGGPYTSPDTKSEKEVTPSKAQPGPSDDTSVDADSEALVEASEPEQRRLGHPRRG